MLGSRCSAIMAPFLLLLFFILFSVNSSESTHTIEPTIYVFQQNTNMDNTNNWESTALPCVSDAMIFDDESTPVVTMLGNDMEFSAIVLPQHGSILFGDDVVLGKRNVRQCSEPLVGKEEYFQPEIKDKFYHDGRNWMRLGDSVLQTPLLHIEQVPSDIDTALFFEQASYRVQIDSLIRVGQLNFSGTYYSTEQFNAGVLWSLEGQWQFRVGKELALPVELETDELFRWPIKNDIVQVTGKSRCEEPAGCFNNNALPQPFAAICGHVTCTKTDHLCANPIRPHGHCCPICGGAIDLYENGIDFSWLKKKLMRLQQETGYRASEFQMGLTLQRVDRDTPMPTYQIAVIPLNPGGGHADVYDEDLIAQFIEEVIAAITIFNSPIKAHHMKSVYSYQHGKFHAGHAFLVLILVLVFILSIVGGVYTYRLTRYNPRWSLFVRRPQHLLTAFWRQNDDDRVHLELTESASQESFGTPMTTSHAMRFKSGHVQEVAIIQAERVSTAKKDNALTATTFVNEVYSGDDGQTQM